MIRNQAVGSCSLVARIGGIVSLLLDNLKVATPNILTQYGKYEKS